MSVYSVPGVGEVSVVIDVQEFYQAGYKLRSLESAHRVGGSEVAGAELTVVRSHLKSLGVIDQ